MLLRRRKHEKSAVRTYSIAAISILILACEIWYVDSLYTRESKLSRMAFSQKFVVNNHPPLSYVLLEQQRGGTTKHLKTSSPLRGEEKGGGDPRLFSRNGGMLNLAHILESVCIASNPCASVKEAQLHAKEAK